MNRKMLPIVFMLIAGAITCIATLVHNYSILEKLFLLLITLVVFGLLGSVLQYLLDYFDKQNEKRLEEEQKILEEQETLQVTAEKK